MISRFKIANNKATPSNDGDFVKYSECADAIEQVLEECDEVTRMLVMVLLSKEPHRAELPAGIWEEIGDSDSVSLARYYDPSQDKIVIELTKAEDERAH